MTSEDSLLANIVHTCIRGVFVCSGSDVGAVEARATLSADQKYYHLNGRKIWISNGEIADLFTVFAKMETEDAEVCTVLCSAFVYSHFSFKRTFYAVCCDDWKCETP